MTCSFTHHIINNIIVIVVFDYVVAEAGAGPPNIYRIIKVRYERCCLQYEA